MIAATLATAITAERKATALPCPIAQAVGQADFGEAGSEVRPRRQRRRLGLPADGLQGTQATAPAAYSGAPMFFQDPLFLYGAVVCFAVFFVVCCVAVWRYKVNKTVKV